MRRVSRMDINTYLCNLSLRSFIGEVLNYCVVDISVPVCFYGLKGSINIHTYMQSDIHTYLHAYMHKEANISKHKQTAQQNQGNDGIHHQKDHNFST